MKALFLALAPTAKDNFRSAVWRRSSTVFSRWRKPLEKAGSGGA